MKSHRRSSRFALAAFGLSALLGLAVTVLPVTAQAAEKVTVRFTWKLKGEYAPLFVALDKGYYKDEGLEVDLAEGSGAQTVLKLVAAGTEQFGYGPAVAVAQAVSKGIPVTVVSLYQTKAPMGVISYPAMPLKTPKDLEGKRLAISVGETFGDMLGTFTKMNNVDIEKIKRIQMADAARSAQFLSKDIDIMSVYLSNELPQLEKKTGVKFNVLKVADFGLHLLGASIFTGTEYAAKNPETVKKVIRATNKGYKDAMADPVAAAKIMEKYFKIPVESDVLLEQVKATVVATNAPADKPIGWQDKADWETNLKLLKETNAISDIMPIDTYFTNKYF